MKRVAIVLAAALVLAALALLLRYDYVSPDERFDRFTGRPEFRRMVRNHDGVMTLEPRAEWLNERELEELLREMRANESALELERMELELEMLRAGNRAREGSRGD